MAYIVPPHITFESTGSVRLFGQVRWNERLATCGSQCYKITLEVAGSMPLLHKNRRNSYSGAAFSLKHARE